MDAFADASTTSTRFRDMSKCGHKIDMFTQSVEAIDISTKRVEMAGRNFMR
jgi:hypothetical protein